MRALVHDQTTHVTDTAAAPIPGKDEVLVHVRRAGICSTDVEITRGYMAFQGTLGHEFVGDVIDPGSPLNGKRVAVEINCTCGRCDMCSGGLATHCRQRTVIGIVGRPGAFAERIAVPRRNCHIVPDTISDDEAVFIEPLAAAYQILRQVRIEPRNRVTVLGSGRLGILIAMVMARTGCRLTVIGRNPHTLGVLDRKRLRAVRIDDIATRYDQDIVIDCTGSPAGLPLAAELVRPRGTIVLKTTVEASEPINLAPIVINEITLIGSRCGPFPDAIAALAAREIDVKPLISVTMPLSKGVEALRRAQDKDVIKVLLDPAK